MWVLDDWKKLKIELLTSWCFGVRHRLVQMFMEVSSRYWIGLGGYCLGYKSNHSHWWLFRLYSNYDWMQRFWSREIFVAALQKAPLFFSLRSDHFRLCAINLRRRWKTTSKLVHLLSTLTMKLFYNTAIHKTKYGSRYLSLLTNHSCPHL